MPMPVHSDLAKPERAAALYTRYLVELSQIGIAEFNLEPDEARELAHSVLVVALGSRHPTDDLHVWLTRSMRLAAEHWSNRV